MKSISYTEVWWLPRTRKNSATGIAYPLRQPFVSTVRGGGAEGSWTWGVDASSKVSLQGPYNLLGSDLVSDTVTETVEYTYTTQSFSGRLAEITDKGLTGLLNVTAQEYITESSQPGQFFRGKKLNARELQLPVQIGNNPAKIPFIGLFTDWLKGFSVNDYEGYFLVRIFDTQTKMVVRERYLKARLTNVEFDTDVDPLTKGDVAGVLEYTADEPFWYQQVVQQNIPSIATLVYGDIDSETDSPQWARFKFGRLGVVRVYGYEEGEPNQLLYTLQWNGEVNGGYALFDTDPKNRGFKFVDYYGNITTPPLSAFTISGGVNQRFFPLDVGRFPLQQFTGTSSYYLEQKKHLTLYST